MKKLSNGKTIESQPYVLPGIQKILMSNLTGIHIIQQTFRIYFNQQFNLAQHQILVQSLQQQSILYEIINDSQILRDQIKIINRKIYNNGIVNDQIIYEGKLYEDIIPYAIRSYHSNIINNDQSTINIQIKLSIYVQKQLYNKFPKQPQEQQKWPKFRQSCQFKQNQTYKYKRNNKSGKIRIGENIGNQARKCYCCNFQNYEEQRKSFKQKIQNNQRQPNKLIFKKLNNNPNYSIQNTSKKPNIKQSNFNSNKKQNKKTQLLKYPTYHWTSNFQNTIKKVHPNNQKTSNNSVFWANKNRQNENTDRITKPNFNIQLLENNFNLYQQNKQNILGKTKQQQIFVNDKKNIRSKCIQGFKNIRTKQEQNKKNIPLKNSIKYKNQQKQKQKQQKRDQNALKILQYGNQDLKEQKIKQTKISKTINQKVQINKKDIASNQDMIYQNQNNLFDNMKTKIKKKKIEKDKLKLLNKQDNIKNKIKHGVNLDEKSQKIVQENSNKINIICFKQNNQNEISQSKNNFNNEAALKQQLKNQLYKNQILNSNKLNKQLHLVQINQNCQAKQKILRYSNHIITQIQLKKQNNEVDLNFLSKTNNNKQKQLESQEIIKKEQEKMNNEVGFNFLSKAQNNEQKQLESQKLIAKLQKTKNYYYSQVGVSLNKNINNQIKIQLQYQQQNLNQKYHLLENIIIPNKQQIILSRIDVQNQQINKNQINQQNSNQIKMKEPYKSQSDRQNKQNKSAYISSFKTLNNLSENIKLQIQQIQNKQTQKNKFILNQNSQPFLKDILIELPTASLINNIFAKIQNSQYNFQTDKAISWKQKNQDQELQIQQFIRNQYQDILNITQLINDQMQIQLVKSNKQNFTSQQNKIFSNIVILENQLFNKSFSFYGKDKINILTEINIYLEQLQDRVFHLISTNFSLKLIQLNQQNYLYNQQIQLQQSKIDLQKQKQVITQTIKQYLESIQQYYIYMKMQQTQKNIIIQYKKHKNYYKQILNDNIQLLAFIEKNNNKQVENNFFNIKNDNVSKKLFSKSYRQRQKQFVQNIQMQNINQQTLHQINISQSQVFQNKSNQISQQKLLEMQSLQPQQKLKVVFQNYDCLLQTQSVQPVSNIEVFDNLQPLSNTILLPTIVQQDKNLEVKFIENQLQISSVASKVYQSNLTQQIKSYVLQNIQKNKKILNSTNYADPEFHYFYQTQYQNNLVIQDMKSYKKQKQILNNINQKNQKSLDHPKIINYIDQSELVQIQFFQGISESQLTQKKLCFKNTMILVQYLMGYSYIFENLICQKALEICIFHHGQWKIIEYNQKLSILKPIEILEMIVCNYIQKGIIQCIQMLTGIPVRCIQQGHNNRIARAVNFYLNGQNKNKQDTTIFVQYSQLALLVKNIQSYKSFIQKDNKNVHILECQQIKGKIQQNQIHHIDSIKIEKIFLGQFFSNLRYKKIVLNYDILNKQSSYPHFFTIYNTFQLNLSNVVIYLNGKFNFLLYKQILKDKYQLVWEAKRWLKYEANNQLLNYLLIVQTYESVINQNNTNNIVLTLRYLPKKTKRSLQLKSIFKCVKSTNSKAKDGRYQSDKLSYIPVKLKQNKKGILKYL